MSLWTVGHLFYAMRHKVLAEAAALTCSVLHEVSRLRPLDCRFQDPAPASINPSFDLKYGKSSILHQPDCFSCMHAMSGDARELASGERQPGLQDMP